MNDNPLAPRKKSAPAPQAQQGPMPNSFVSPMHAHAAIWNGANNVPHDELDQLTAKTDYAIPVLGALASNPKVTGKDVIKALADSAANNYISPSEAVKLIQQIPESQEDIRPWLKSLYAFNLTAAVHLKAAALRRDAGVEAGMPVPAVPAPMQTAPQPEAPQGAPV